VGLAQIEEQIGANAVKVLQWVVLVALAVYCVALDYDVTAINCRLDGGDWKAYGMGGRCERSAQSSQK